MSFGTCSLMHTHVYSNTHPTRCNVTQFIYVWKLLYMFRVVSPPILRSTHNCIYSILHLSDRKLLPVAIIEELELLFSSISSTIVTVSSNGLASTRCCRYSCVCSWWWVEIPPETRRAVSRYNKLCNLASCWIYRVTQKKRELLKNPTKI